MAIIEDMRFPLGPNPNTTTAEVRAAADAARGRKTGTQRMADMAAAVYGERAKDLPGTAWQGPQSEALKQIGAFEQAIGDARTQSERRFFTGMMNDAFNTSPRQPAQTAQTAQPAQTGLGAQARRRRQQVADVRDPGRERRLSDAIFSRAATRRPDVTSIASRFGPTRFMPVNASAPTPADDTNQIMWSRLNT